MRSLVVLLVILVGAQPALADRRRNDVVAPADRREAVKKKIRALRAYTLTEELALDAATSAKLFPVLAKWDDVTDKLLVTRADLTRQLAAADARTDPRTINRLIDDSIANQRAFWDLEDKRLAELRKILTPAQTAQILLVLPAFERRIQNQLRKAIQNRRGGATRRGGDDLDDLDGDEDNDRAVPGRRVNPYSRSPIGDPFDTDTTAPPPPRAPAPAPRSKPCDPFSSSRPCP